MKTIVSSKVRLVKVASYQKRGFFASLRTNGKSLGSEIKFHFRTIFFQSQPKSKHFQSTNFSNSWARKELSIHNKTGRVASLNLAFFTWICMFSKQSLCSTRNINIITRFPFFRQSQQVSSIYWIKFNRNGLAKSEKSKVLCCYWL